MGPALALAGLFAASVPPLVAPAADGTPAVRTLAAAVRFEADGVWLDLARAGSARPGGRSRAVRGTSHVLRWGLDEQRDCAAVAVEPTPARVNVYSGAEPARWREGLPTWKRVLYPCAAPGISADVAPVPSGLAYRLHLAQGAPPLVRLRWRGIAALERKGDGALRIALFDGELTETGLRAWQEGGRELTARFGSVRREADGSWTYGIEVEGHDPTRPIEIDPTISWSTYLGGMAGDGANGLDVSGTGAAFVTGSTASADFHSTGGMQTMSGGGIDAFVTRVSPDGLVVWSTYLGGTGEDNGLAIVVDVENGPVVSGDTASSADFPRLAASQGTFGGGIADGFVTRFTASGTMLWSTFLGGAGSENQFASAVVVHSDGSVYVTGETGASDFPVLNPFQSQLSGFTDVYVTKLTASGALAYSTYLGGNRNEQAYGITVDAAGSAYVVGKTSSSGFPTPGGFDQNFNSGSNDDGFVTKLAPGGDTLVWSSFVGGGSTEWTYAVEVDRAGAAYVAGATFSTDFPVMGAFQPMSGGPYDAFLVKVNAAGNAVLWSSYFGGFDNEGFQAIALDGADDLMLVGETLSADMPTVAPLQSANDGGFEAIAVGVRSSGTLWFATYLGGSAHDYAYGVAFNAAGDALLAGITASPNFPLVTPAFGTFRGGVNDVWVMKLVDAGAPFDGGFGPPGDAGATGAGGGAGGGGGGSAGGGSGGGTAVGGGAAGGSSGGGSGAGGGVAAGGGTACGLPRCEPWVLNVGCACDAGPAALLAVLALAALRRRASAPSRP